MCVSDLLKILLREIIIWKALLRSSIAAVFVADKIEQNGIQAIKEDLALLLEHVIKRGRF